MMFMTLEDLVGTLDVILFPDAYRRAKAVLGGSAQQKGLARAAKRLKETEDG